MQERHLHNVPRLYISGADLAPEKMLFLPEDQAHYLRSVLRKSVGDPLRVFNGQDGEWRAAVTVSDKKSVQIKLEEQLRPQMPLKDIALVISPIKKERLEWLVEKCAELGLMHLALVTMDHTARPHFNLQRLKSIAIEAAEQSEQLNIMMISEYSDLQSYLSGSGQGKKTFACLERQQGPGFAQHQDSLKSVKACAVLVGPEGGLSAAEKTMLSNHPDVLPVNLGDDVLRSETAALVALSQVKLFFAG